jgi:hypothetical protein
VVIVFVAAATVVGVTVAVDGCGKAVAVGGSGDDVARGEAVGAGEMVGIAAASGGVAWSTSVARASATMPMAASAAERSCRDKDMVGRPVGTARIMSTTKGLA